MTVLPELAVNKDLFAFWKDTANNENVSELAVNVHSALVCMYVCIYTYVLVSWCAGELWVAQKEKVC